MQQQSREFSATESASSLKMLTEEPLIKVELKM